MRKCQELEKKLVGLEGKSTIRKETKKQKKQNGKQTKKIKGKTKCGLAARLHPCSFLSVCSLDRCWDAMLNLHCILEIGGKRGRHTHTGPFDPWVMDGWTIGGLYLCVCLCLRACLFVFACM